MASAAQTRRARQAVPPLPVQPLLVTAAALVTFSAVMVGSAAVAQSAPYLETHLVYITLALVAFGGAFAVPPMWWHRLYLLGWLGALAIAVAVLVPGLGHEANGATRWLKLGGFTIQAAEVAKGGLCVYLAGYLARHAGKLGDDAGVLFLPLAMVAIICGLLVLEPDLGSAVVLMGATVGLLFVAGAKLRYFFLFAVLGAGLLALLIWIEPYRMQRFVAFLDPWAVQYGSGYQLTQALIAFGRGELFGLGLGEGVQKLFYLPEAHTDFIFAVIAEELGSIGAIVVAGTLTFLVATLLRISRLSLEAGRLFAGYAAYFCALLIAIQFLVSLGVNTGVLPTKGLTLPFVSYGGNSLIVFCALLGLVLRCACEPERKRG